MRALRIVFVAACPFPFPRGTPVRIHRLAEAMARRGHEMHVATYHLGETFHLGEVIGAGTGTPLSIHRIPRIPFYRRTAPGPSWTKLLVLDPLLAWKLRMLLGAHDFDLVHAHHYEGLLAALWARGRRPIVYDAHTTLASELPFYSMGLPARWKGSLARILDRRLPRRAAHIVAVSREVKESLVRCDAAPPEKVTVITNGVEWNAFRVPEERRWKAEPGTRTVVYAGNLAPYQGIDLLLEAFASVRRRRRDVRLLIASEASFSPYERLARDLGVRDAILLERAGFGELPALLAGADVAVSPRVECAGVPQKLLNYMAAGKPIASFDGSAALLDHERTGLRVRDGDAGAMAEAVLRLLDDPILARRLGDAASSQAREEHSWDVSAAKVEEVYERVLGEAGGTGDRENRP